MPAGEDMIVEVKRGESEISIAVCSVFDLFYAAWQAPSNDAVLSNKTKTSLCCPPSCHLNSTVKLIRKLSNLEDRVEVVLPKCLADQRPTPQWLQQTMCVCQLLKCWSVCRLDACFSVKRAPHNSTMAPMVQLWPPQRTHRSACQYNAFSELPLSVCCGQKQLKCMLRDYFVGALTRRCCKCQTPWITTTHATPLWEATLLSRVMSILSVWGQLINYAWVRH